MSGDFDRNIEVRGASEHNLKGIDVSLPRGRLVVVTGVSGSGKSSLAFDTLFREGQRRFLETMPSYARSFSGGLSKPTAVAISGLGPAIAIGQRVGTRNPRSTVGTMTEVYDLLRLLFARLGKSESGVAPTRGLFSFNGEEGACPACQGLGLEDRLDPASILADAGKTIREGALRVSTPNGYLMYSQVTLAVLDEVLRAHGGDVDTPWNLLSDEARDVVFRGSQRLKVPFGKHPLESRMKWTGITARPRQEGFYRGLLPIMEEILKGKRNDSILRFVRTRECSACGGDRLKPDALSVTWRGRRIVDFAKLRPRELRDGLLEIGAETDREAAVLEPIRGEIVARCDLMMELGLGYLALDRAATTISPGEAQRLKLLALALGELRGLLIVLDEPSAGLHPREAKGLVDVLRRIRDRGQTVVVVEHDPAVVSAADWIVELGPGPGESGGEVLYSGPPSAKIETGVTEIRIECRGVIPSRPQSLAVRARRNGGGLVAFEGLSLNNLDGIDVEILREGMNVVTGLSGSGKSSLLAEVVSRIGDGACGGFRRVVTVDADPIGRTPRSNPATYSGAFDAIRDLFAATEEAKARSLAKGSFSFNTAGGRCETCEGAGAIEIGMRYLGSVDLVCESCGGRRFHPEVLAVSYRGHSIADVLETSISDAAALFSDHAKLARILSALVDAGLGYLRLGQPATTLSGGEAQRVKLATELAKAGKGASLIVLDDPSTGLHAADVARLMIFWDKLLDAGHTVLAADNDLGLVRAADRIIDLGPGSGPEGGRVVFQGPPSELVRCGDFTAGASSREGGGAVASMPRGVAHPPMSLEGVRTHNLTGIDVAIPSRGLTVVTGPSGCGKSSLIFDTLLAEARNRFADFVAPWARRFLPRRGGAELDAAREIQAAIAVPQRSGRRNPRSTVGTLSEIDDLLRLLFSRFGAPRVAWAGALSSNTEAGACPMCRGLGFVPRCDPESLVSRPDLPLAGGAMNGTRFGAYLGEPGGQHMATLAAAAAARGLDVSRPWDALGERERALALEGAGEEELEIIWKYKRGKREGEHRFRGPWPGLLTLVEREHERIHSERKGESLEGLMRDATCPACAGEKLREEARAVAFAGRRLPEIARGSLEAMRAWLDAVGENPGSSGVASLDLEGSRSLRGDLASRLDRLLDAGLGYLASGREIATLSGGELQRLRLASALGGGGLVGVTYALDEPTQGLHPRDVARLSGVLRRVADAGNAVVVVEHEASIVAAADHVIELGPGAGPDGGRVMAEGAPGQLPKGCRTARLLARRECVAETRCRRRPLPGVELRGARCNNLRGIDVAFPSNALVAVTGVSGSGKSTLVHGVLGPSLEKLTKRTSEARRFGETSPPAPPRAGEGKEGTAENPSGGEVSISGGELSSIELHVPVSSVLLLGQTSATAAGQSSVATLTGVAEALRKRFVATAEAKARRLSAKHFSTATPGGRCEACEGRGFVAVAMDLLPDVTVGCEACGGKRFEAEVLAVSVRGLDIAGALDATISDLVARFETDAAIASPLRALEAIGLGYLTLGQDARALSHGERQRLELALLLARAEAGPTAVLLDEPTRGLGFEDVDRLIDALHRLVDRGHLVVVVEHDLDLIAASDWVIDLGPEGGDGGGLVVAEGPPEAVMKVAASHTGRALRERARR